MKKVFVSFFVVIAIMVNGGVFMSCTGISPEKEGVEKKENGESAAENKQEIKKAVHIALVKNVERQISIFSSGRLNAFSQVDLISQVSGVISTKNTPLKIGASFLKGDLLFHVFDDETELKLKASKSQFLSSLAKVMPNVKIDFSGEYSKWVDFLESIKLDKALPDLPKITNSKLRIYLSTQGILNSYYKIKAEEVRLSYHDIYAPFSGTYTNIYFQEGSVVNPGTRVGNIIRTDYFELNIPMTRYDVRFLKKGKPVKVWSEDRSYQWDGKIERISEFVDPSTQSVGVIVKVKQDRNNPLYQGMYLDVEVADIPISEVMAIPRNAVFNGNNVFIVKEGKLHKMKVNIAKIANEKAYFTGLKQGDMVVMEPLANAVERMEVAVIKETSL
ncbi:MAG: efflux RND transporter periplasmic adaptor subunit [Bacteroidales bacterium]